MCILLGVEAPDGTLYFGTDAGVLRVADGERSVWSAPDAPTVANLGTITAGPEAGAGVVRSRSSAVPSTAFDRAANAWQPGPALGCEYCVPLARDGRRPPVGRGDLGVWVFDAAGDTVAYPTTARACRLMASTAWRLRPPARRPATPGGVAVYDGESITAVYHLGHGRAGHRPLGCAAWAALAWGVVGRR